MPKNLRRMIRDSQSCELQNQRDECPTLARTKPARVGHPPELTCHEAASLGSIPAHQGVAHPLGWVRSSRWQDTTLSINREVIKNKEVGGLPFADCAKGGLFFFLLCLRISGG